MQMKSINTTRLLDTECETYGDSAQGMTPSRLFARFMSQFVLYNPNANKKGGPSIDKAWAYYENVTLARICTNADGETIRAQVGDNRPSKLYPYWKTSVHDMKAFGISARMYFSSLRILYINLFYTGI